MELADRNKKVRYYVTNFLSSTLSVIDGVSNSIVRTYTVGEGPREVVAGEDGAVYIASSGSNTITIIAPTGTSKVLNIPNSGYVAVDVIMGRMYVAFKGELRVYDIESGGLVVTISGLKNPEYITLNKTRDKLFIIDDNTIYVYSTITLEHVNTITLTEKANFITISNDDTKAYISYGTQLSTAGVQVYNLRNNTVIANVTDELLTNPFGMVQRNNILYIANNCSDGSIFTLDTTTYNLLPKSIEVGARPLRLALSEDSSRLYIVNSGSGDIRVLDILTNKVDIIKLTEGSEPFAIARSTSKMESFVEETQEYIDDGDILDIKESVCVMVKKVFAQCQQRICFPMVNIPMPFESGRVTLERMVFENGSIVMGTLQVNALPDRPNFSRVQFALTVPFRAVLRLANGETVTVSGVLPEILKDIVMFRPQTRDEFAFETIVETRSEVLSSPNITSNTINIAVGVFVVIKVVGEVQLFIPAYGYCPEPPECEEYEEPEDEDICQVFLDFNQTPFPEDFFPPSV